MVNHARYMHCVYLVFLKTVTTVVGHSNVGKSTLVNHALVAAQRKGRIPVIYDTENNFDFTYAMDMGFEAEPVYDDVEVEKDRPRNRRTYNCKEKEKKNCFIRG